jgi:DNA-directed RNA polymerase II subunit RPB2
VDASTNKLTNPRHLHNTQYGTVCPVETPEGAKVGLVKSLSMMGNITLMLKSQIYIINKLLENYIIDLEDVFSHDLNKYVKVFLNGTWLGIVKNPNDLIQTLKKMRQNGKLEKTVSIVFDILFKEIKIYCDAGRLNRPLLIVKDNKLLITKKIIDEIDIKSNNTTKISKWNNLIQKYPEIIEYVDIEESNGLMIAMYMKDINKMRVISNLSLNKNPEDTRINRYDNNVFLRYTHCEIHPSLCLGIVASSIPYCNHNQSPRNIYQYSQARQAMGIYNSSYRHRLDISYVLHYPQPPLIQTRSAKYIHTDKLAAGENAIVAICTYSGYNQEDSIIVNQSAIDRGLFSAVSFKKYQETIAKNPSTSQDDVFTKPDRNKVIGTKSGSYDKLNDKGYVPEETKVVNGDIIIGKISPIQPMGNNNKSYKDSSISYKSNIPGVIDKVWTNIYNYEGYEMYKMRVRSLRIPKIGDKMSSRHGQKGTIGITLKQEDMPFTEDGISPDLIINPNCIPSRMTVGQLIECVMGKVSAIKGHDSDGTPFNELSVQDIKEELKKLGYHESGKEYLYNGMNGKKMKAMIFIGPTYYQRLKHLVDDKIHSRARGPRQLLTRQPPEGRSRDGGLRFGEMERDCMIAHGMGQFLKERMMETSDIYNTHVCDICGFFAQQMLGSPGVYYCQQCDNSTDISEINLTYAFKLLVQELMSMNIAPRIRVKKDIYNDLI